MLCCGLAACTLAAAALPRSRGRRGAAVGARRLLLASAAAAAAAALTLGLGAGVAIHLDHHRLRAEQSQRSLLAQILAAPLCGGAPFAQP